jgi:flagellar biosynthesis/type III secretory pathway protein FliH
MLAKKHPELKEAVSCVEKMSLGERWRWAMLNYQMWKMDQEAEKEQIQLDLAEARMAAQTEGRAAGHAEGHAEGHAAGHAEGHAEGFEEKTLEIARKMKEMGDSVERIHTITGLSPETVQEL